MKRKSRGRLSAILWMLVLVFMAVIITFPKWITVFYPQPNRDIVFSEAYESKVDPYLVFAIIRAESKFQTHAESPAGAKGLMQIMPDTAEWIAEQQGITDYSTINLHDPQDNIQFGCWYLSDLMKEFDGQIPLVAAAYNAGRGTVSEWIAGGQWNGDPNRLKDIPFEETRQYVMNVLKNYEAYQEIYT